MAYLFSKKLSKKLNKKANKKANKKRTSFLLALFAFNAFFSVFSFAQNEDKPNEADKKKAPAIKKATKRQGPLIINSQVKGSQEQPNVMYILPWQGIENPIIIEGKSKEIVLPTFQPIHPKNFKNQVILFHQQKTIKD